MPVKRDLSSYFTAINETSAPVRSKPSYQIENLFKPTFKDGKADVVMRFLPSHPTEFKPFIENRSHLFKVAGDKWFGCDCLEKFGKECPICKYNRELYKTLSKEEAGKLRLGNRASKKYISNVYIVRNDNAPETEGKVFRFEYGVSIMDKIRTAMAGFDDPDEGHVEGFNPFDWETGANFIYTGVMGAFGPDIKQSRFSKQKPLSDKNNRVLSTDELDAIEAQLFTLDDCDRKEDQCDSFDKIVARYKEKTGIDLFPSASSPVADAMTASTQKVTENVAPAAPAPKAPAPAPAAPAAPAATDSEDDFFASLAAL